MDNHLSGTRPLPNTELIWNHTFADRYAKQWEASLQWTTNELQRMAEERDVRRGRSQEWLKERRAKLRELTGVGLFESVPEQLRLYPGADGEKLYELRLQNGLLLAGAVRLPLSGEAKAVVLLADAEGDAGPAGNEGAGGVKTPGESQPASAFDMAARYAENGLAVIRPFVLQSRKSFADHPSRKWYKYDDDELIQFFTFICGGSLAGLEAFELNAAASVVPGALGLPEQAPLLLDARGRALLSGAAMAALYPGSAAAIRLDAEAERLNRQELDARANTIWAYHRHFDSLTLLQLAERSDLLFSERGATPSVVAARAMVWFGPGGPGEAEGRRVLRTAADQAEEAALALLASRSGHVIRAPRREPDGAIPIERTDEPQTAGRLYMRSLESKLAHAEALHEQARARKAKRYDIAAIGAEAYRERIRGALTTVMGEPLPRSAGLNARTRRIEDSSGNQLNLTAYDMYEVLLETVPGIDTAGYLLLPKGKGPFPAVVCQHGLTGRPEDVIGLTHKRSYYYRIAHILAEKEIAAFVPFMNWGWGGMPGRDRLAKHSYALGMTPNRFETAQLAAVIDFLQSRPEIRPDRIGFYGLSYGGHASVWLGACEPRLAAVVTSGHFNDWHRKLTSTEVIAPHPAPRSYICALEGMDMFTYNVLNELGHAEMTTLHAPRPYMVENGLRDGVAPAQWVDEEFSRVAAVFAHLGAEEHARLTHFDGGHRIWGEETLLFLNKHLR